jgi:hypothetical protein
MIRKSVKRFSDKIMLSNKQGAGTVRSCRSMPNIAAPGELPEVLPVFRCPAHLLLPRGQMPLNIFEPRYLAMVDDAFRDGHRLIGMIQPERTHSPNEKAPSAVPCRLRRPHHPAGRDRRWPLHPRIDRISRYKVIEELTVLYTLPAMQGRLLRLRR